MTNKKNELQIIVKESGLEKTKAKFLLDNFTSYFELASEWETKAKAIIVKDETNLAEMKMARAGRLFLREKRIAIEKSRVELKSQALREGKAIDGIANVLKALIVPIEEYLNEQEHFVEIKEKAEAEQKRIDDEKKEEEERLSKEEADRKEQEKMRLENVKLQKEAKAREKKMLEEREKAEAERFKLEEKARKEREETERLAKIKQEKADKILAEEREKVEKERLEKEKAQKLLDEQIECPYCKKKFNIDKKRGD